MRVPSGGTENLNIGQFSEQHAVVNKTSGEISRIKYAELERELRYKTH